MATVVITAQRHSAKLEMVILALAAFTGLLFSFAAPLAKRMGVAGMRVVTRIMGMVLAAIAVGMLTQGLKAMLPGLAG